MKAKEYFNQVLNENKDKIIEWRLCNAFNNMILEAKQIAKIRKAKSEQAWLNIFKELEIKSYAFIAMCNEIEPFKSEGNIKRDAFVLYLEQTQPKLSSIYKKLKGENNDNSRND